MMKLIELIIKAFLQSIENNYYREEHKHLKDQGLREKVSTYLVASCIYGLVLVFILSIGSWLIISISNKAISVFQGDPTQNIEMSLEKISNQDYFKKFCSMKEACKSYSQVRLECATAGNFKNCMEIKLGDKTNEVLNDGGGAENICKNDGQINTSGAMINSQTVTSDNHQPIEEHKSLIPTYLQCMFH